MIYIQKIHEPKSLTEYKKQAYAYYGGCNKADIRKNLLQEQGYLCAYCMRRIHDDKMKIEHWKPREGVDDSPHALDYRNMLGVCKGHIEEVEQDHHNHRWNRNQDRKEKCQGDTCDASKGEDRIKVNPLDASTLSSIYYVSKNGEIHAIDPEVEQDFMVTLNLNSTKQNLPINRKQKLKSVINEMSKMFPTKKSWTKSNINKVIEKYSSPDENGQKSEYAGIVLWYLNKKLNG